jgi:hypothetical protein
MGIFSKIGKVGAARPKGQFFTKGRYDVSVVSVRHVESKVGSDQFFVVDFDIQESTNPDLPAGTAATWMTKLNGKYPDMALADIKAFVMAATNADEEDVDEATIEEALEGDGTALAGMALRIVVDNVKTKANTDFSKHNFYAVTE